MEDTVTAWSVGQRIGTNAVTLAGWDGRQLAGVSAQAEVSSRPSAIPVLEVYRGHGDRRHADGQVAQAQPEPAPPWPRSVPPP